VRGGWCRGTEPGGVIGRHTSPLILSHVCPLIDWVMARCPRPTMRRNPCPLEGRFARTAIFAQASWSLESTIMNDNRVIGLCLVRSE